MEKTVGQSFGNFIIAIDPFEAIFVERKIGFSDFEIIFVGWVSADFLGKVEDWRPSAGWWIDGRVWNGCKVERFQGRICRKSGAGSG